MMMLSLVLLVLVIGVVDAVPDDPVAEETLAYVPGEPLEFFVVGCPYDFLFICDTKPTPYSRFVNAHFQKK